MRDQRVYALQFDLETRPPRSTCIIVWPDGPVGRCVPVDRDRDWMDVQAGEQLFVDGKRRTVTAVRIYRGDGAANSVPVVTCGRDWGQVASAVDHGADSKP